jgi:hypothetical protein
VIEVPVYRNEKCMPVCCNMGRKYLTIFSTHIKARDVRSRKRFDTTFISAVNKIIYTVKIYYGF